MKSAPQFYIFFFYVDPFLHPSARAKLLVRLILSNSSDRVGLLNRSYVEHKRPKVILSKYSQTQL